jgi:hypothetical protein
VKHNECVESEGVVRSKGHRRRHCVKVGEKGQLRTEDDDHSGI